MSETCPRHVHRLTDSEIEAVSLFLAASVPLLAALPPHHLHAMLRASSVLILEPEGPPLYERGEPCAGCTVVLQGRLSTRVACGAHSLVREGAGAERHCVTGRFVPLRRL